MKKIEYAKILTFAKKIKAVKLLGNKCEKCGEDNIFKLVFHHPNNDKEYNFQRLKTYRWSKIKKEILKCELLCSNCHRELHYNEKKPNDTRSRDNKKILLEYIGKKECKICGYNKCYASLDFHHKNDKKANLSDLIGKQKYTLSNLLNWIDEVNKCELVCSNCHKEKHVDKEFFEKNYNLIIEKVNNYKEIQSKIDREEVRKMYENGIKQVEIAKHFNASKGTISDIIKKIKYKSID